MTNEDYQKAIPACCSHKTVEQHEEVMLYCWGIIKGLVQEQGESYCEECSENVNCKSQSIRQVILTTHKEQRDEL